MKIITEEQKALLSKPLPTDAIQDRTGKPGFSSIKAIYVTERLNEVFGIGLWQVKTELISEKNFTQSTKSGQKQKTMVVAKTTLTIPEYNIYYECFGGNDNDDYGDAFKGATTDAITKIGSYMGIGAHVWKGEPYVAAKAGETAGFIENKQQQVYDFLMANDKARDYYCNKFGVGEIQMLTDDNITVIYNELKSKNKI